MFKPSTNADLRPTLVAGAAAFTGGYGVFSLSASAATMSPFIRCR